MGRYSCWLLLVAAIEQPLLAAEDWQYPLNVTATTDGTLYVADRNLPGVWKVTPEGEKSVFFQASKKLRTPLNAVRCIALDRQGRVLAGDSATREVYRFNDAGEPVPLTMGGIGIPMGIAVSSAGKLFVADLELHRICRVPAEGGSAETFIVVQAPRALTIDAEDRLWVISDAPQRGQKEFNQVLRITLAGKQEALVQGRVFAFPGGITLDSRGAAYVSDGYGKTIWKIPPGDKPEPWISGEPLNHPVGVTWHQDRLLIADPRAKVIFEASDDGKLSCLAK